LLLGYPAGPAARWLVLLAVQPRVALMFDRFDGYLQVSRERGPSPAVLDASRPHVREVVRCAEGLRPVLHVDSVLEAIATNARQAAPREE
jgi:hypothetical protein